MQPPPVHAPSPPPQEAAPSAALLPTVLMLVFVALFITHAWVVDDAYITLRTVHNFVNGLGLRWNVVERVQAYTHPLWMFALSAAYAVTREAFLTTLAVSFTVSLAAVLAAGRLAGRTGEPWRKALLLGVLLASKAFLDFCSSGLENPLTHLLLALFFGRFLFPARPWVEAPPRQVGWLFFVAALAFLNRQDTLLFLMPACLFVLQAQLRDRGLPGLRRIAPGVGLALLPAFAWLAFSFLYYGSTVPNTALAKLIGPRLHAREQLQAGAAYFLDSLFIDFATLPLCALALYLCFRRRDPAFRCLAIGMVLYLLYVAAAGAVGTHMSGRFFSGVVFLAAIVIALLVRSWQQALPIGGLAALVLVASPFSPLRVGTSGYAKPQMARPEGAIIDTRYYVMQEGAALLNLRHRGPMPFHSAYLAGLGMRAAPRKVFEGGPPPFNLMIGYAGYAAGPDKHLVDVLGLSDPLIARVPLARGAAWGPGHFQRTVPRGYIASIESGSNRIEDANLRPYYEAIRVVTQGPVFSGERLGVLWRLSTGQYDHHLQAYAAAHDLRW
jgi:arabinofuranosyltransferase